MKFLLFLCLVSVSWGNTTTTVEGSATRNIQRLLAEYKRMHPGSQIVGWEQIEQIDTGLQRTNSFFKEGTAAQFYSFIPLAERAKFPKGNLILVQYHSIPWPDALKTEDNNQAGKYQFHPSHQDVRYLIYESKDGAFRAERWYEADFQKIIAETGLNVPPPTPYYPKQPTPLGEKPASTSAPVAAVVSAPTAPTAAPAATTTPAPVAQPPAKSSNPLWWIAGAIAALVAVVLVVRRKKPKA